MLALVTAVIFLVKALATYGPSVMMARIGNRIVALNQRQMFNALINQNVAFFSERHSSEFMARLTTGATAASQVINLLITAIGRDLLSLIALAGRDGGARSRSCRSSASSWRRRPSSCCAR